MSQSPNQKRKGEHAGTKSNSAPNPDLRKTPPHDQTRCDPNQESNANDIHHDGPEEIQEQRVMIAAAKVHSHDNLIPSELLPLDAQFVFVDQIRQPRLIEEAPPRDAQLGGIRPLHVEC